MVSCIGRLVAIAIVVWLGSTPAQATSFASAMCLQGPVETGFGHADCRLLQYAGSPPGVAVPGWGEAHADLQTGILKSLSHAEGQRSDANPADAQGAQGNSTASFFDTITIGGSYSGPVQLRMEVSGAFLMNIPYGNYGSATGPLDPGVTAQLFMWDPNDRDRSMVEAVAFVEQYTSQFLIHVEQERGSVLDNANSSGIFADPADVRLVLTTSFLVTPSTPAFTFEALLGSHTDINALAVAPGETRVSEVNFAHTADLSLILPEGVPWTSESGVFLQSVPESVPEPGAWALLAAGMLLLSVVGRVPRSTGRGCSIARRQSRALRALLERW